MRKIIFFTIILLSISLSFCSGGTNENKSTKKEMSNDEKSIVSEIQSISYENQDASKTLETVNKYYKKAEILNSKHIAQAIYTSYKSSYIYKDKKKVIDTYKYMEALDKSEKSKNNLKAMEELENMELRLKTKFGVQ